MVFTYPPRRVYIGLCVCLFYPPKNRIFMHLVCDSDRACCMLYDVCINMITSSHIGQNREIIVMCTLEI